MQKLLLLVLTLPLAAAPIVDETFTNTMPNLWETSLTPTGPAWDVPTGQSGARAAIGPYTLVSLISPAFSIGQFPVTLTLQYGILTGDGNAGMVLEYTINDGVYAGVDGNFTQGGYDGVVTNAYPNPILGPLTSRPVWANGGGTAVLSIAPGSVPANSTIRFRFLLGTSFSGAQAGLSRFTLADAAPGEPTPVPEPSTILLTALPLAALALRRKLPLLLLAALTLPLSAGIIVDETFDRPNRTLPPDWFSFIDVGSGTPWEIPLENEVAQTTILPFSSSYLYSPTFAIPAAPVTLTLMIGSFPPAETNGGLVLEYSRDNAAYIDVDGNAQFLQGSYNAKIPLVSGNPILNGSPQRNVWGQFFGTSVLVFDSSAPSTLKFRFIAGTDGNNTVARLVRFTLEAADPEVTPAPVPEPSTILLTALPLAALALRRKLPLVLLAALTIPLSAGTIVDQSFNLPNGNLPPDWFSFLDLGTGTPWTVAPGNDTARTEINAFTTSYLYSPTFNVPNFPATLTVNLGVLSLATTGLVLEYSLNNGAYTDVSSTAQFLAFPYNGVLTTTDANPLLNGASSRPAWTGNVGTSTLVFDLQPLATPATLKFRFVFGSGSRGGVAGLSRFTLEAADPELPPASVPEPSTILLTAIPLAALARKLR